MEFSFDNIQSQELINTFSSILKTKKKVDCLEERINLDKEQGSGYISGFEFGDGVSLLVFNFKLKNDWTFVMKHVPSPLLFTFCVEGTVEHFMSEKNIQYVLNPLRGTIMAHDRNSHQRLRFSENVQTLLAVLVVDRKAYYKKVECILETMPDKLTSVFKDVEGEQTYFYHSNYSLSIAECVRDIVNDENTGLVRSTKVEGKALELLSMQIKQFNDDQKRSGKQIVLRKDDVDQIQIARKILVENYQNPPTIVELSRKSGINQQKLKQGFKMVYDNTINNYVRGYRLQIAAKKLLTGKTVREAADEVGYANQSHFARRFKDKYGVLPKDYLKSVRRKVFGNEVMNE